MVDFFDRMTMQVIVRWYCTMIATAVQCDVDGIPKGSHFARVPPMGKTGNGSPLLARGVEFRCANT